MAVLATRGRTLMALAISERPLHLAWGVGDPAWDTVPVAEDIDALELVDELGRAHALVVGFATIVEEGDELADDIQTPTGRWRISAEPTNNLYLRVNFGYGAAVGETIREVALFADTVVVEGLPLGQVYFTPDQVADGGDVIAFERFPAYPLNAFERKEYEFVLEI